MNKDDIIISLLKGIEANILNSGGNQEEIDTGWTFQKSLYSLASKNSTIINKANGNSSIAIGMGTTAIGTASLAEGLQTVANGDYSHAEGQFTRTENTCEHAEGQYNYSNFLSTADSGKTIHSIGIGTSATNRKNGFEVMYNGDVYVYGIGNYDGTNAVASSTSTNKSGIKLQDAIYSIPYINMIAEDPVVILPNRYYNFDTVGDTLNIVKSGEVLEDMVNTYIFKFTISSDVEQFNLTLVEFEELSWFGGSVPTWVPGNTYEISILDNAVCYAEFEPVAV